ncbi:MAG: hypothetical protein ACW99A_19035, partial [Candidatus Kariarchaeaceae archaeon]
MKGFKLAQFGIMLIVLSMIIPTPYISFSSENNLKTNRKITITRISSTVNKDNYKDGDTKNEIQPYGNPEQIGDNIVFEKKVNSEIKIEKQSVSRITNGFDVITPQEVDPPVFTSFPSNLTFVENAPGQHRLRWKADDANPDRYVVYENQSLYTSGIWSSGQNIQIDVSELYGTYNYTIVLNDTFGNIATDTKYAFVLDVDNPTFTSLPNDLTFSEGSSGNTLSWDAADNYPDTYVTFVNGTQRNTGSWTSILSIIVNVDGLLKGVHNFTIVISDETGNQAVDTVFITVVDTTSPAFDSVPVDFSYAETSIGNTLSWNATDNYPGTFEVYRNGTLTGDAGSWTNAGVITINVDGLVVGIYNYTIMVNDASTNQNTDIVYVTVVTDTVSPIFFITPVDLQYSEGNTGNTLSWNTTDSSPGTFEVYRNGTSTGDSGSWTNEDFITINIDGLLKGTYNYTIVVSDLSDNQISDTVIVTVVDSTFPTFDSIPSDLQYSEGTTPNT